MILICSRAPALLCRALEVDSETFKLKAQKLQLTTNLYFTKSISVQLTPTMLGYFNLRGYSMSEEDLKHRSFSSQPLTKSSVQI